MVRDRSSIYKIDYVIVIKNFLNPKGHQHPISGLKVMAILLKGWILPIGGVASGRVCACSLCSRLVTIAVHPVLVRAYLTALSMAARYYVLIHNLELQSHNFFNFRLMF